MAEPGYEIVIKFRGGRGWVVSFVFDTDIVVNTMISPLGLHKRNPSSGSGPTEPILYVSLERVMWIIRGDRSAL